MRLLTAEIIYIYIYIFRLRLGFFWGPKSLFKEPSNLIKHMYLCILGFYNIIYISKNYFVIVFSVINFLFSVNKLYPNRFSSHS